MITVANRLYVKPEYADAFEKVFRERAGLVDKMEGFISNQILRPVNEGDPYVVFTTWNSRQDFLNWVRSDEFVKGHAQSGTLPKDAYFKTNVLELHEVLQDSSRPELTPEPAAVRSICTRQSGCDAALPQHIAVSLRLYRADVATLS